MAIDLSDRNRYAGRRFFSRIGNFIWSVVLTVAVLVGLVLAVKFFWPWLEALFKEVG